MTTPEVAPGLDALGEDLLLLAIKPNGAVGSAAKIDFGLMGSELVRLAAAGRVDIAGDRIIVRSAQPTGDPELDGALGSVAAAVSRAATGAAVSAATDAAVQAAHDAGAHAGGAGGGGHH
jgi:hypothetical protein